MEERNLEIKVGLLVVAAGVLLAGFIYVMGGVSIEDRFNLYVDFDNPLWLSEGADVRVSGTKAGRVEEITFMGGRLDPAVGRRVYVRVRLGIAERVRDALREDARFYIANQGLLGEQYVEVDPGDIDRPRLDPAKPVKGIDPPRLEKFLIKGYDIVTAVARILDSAGEDASDLLAVLVRVLRATDELIAENRGSLKAIADNTAALADEALGLVRDARATINEGGKVDMILDDVRGVTQGLPAQVDEMLARLDSTLGRADRLVARLDGVVEETLGEPQRRQIRNTVANLEAVSERAIGVADDIVALSTEVRGQVEPVASRVRQAVDSLVLTLTAVGEIVRTVRRGEGTVGALLMDEQVFDDLKELIRDLKHNPWKFFWRE